jgi:hypothetical protein
MIKLLEERLQQHRVDLAHLDATMRLFDPDIRPQEIRPRQQRAALDFLPAVKFLAGRLTRFSKAEVAATTRVRRDSDAVAGPT